MVELLTTACSLGVGALLGVIMFVAYRQDRKTSETRIREDRVYMEDRLTKMIERDQLLIDNGQKSQDSNTKALEGLTTILERMNGRH